MGLDSYKGPDKPGNSRFLQHHLFTALQAQGRPQVLMARGNAQLDFPDIGGGKNPSAHCLSL
jgi:hypothetical protein